MSHKIERLFPFGKQLGTRFDNIATIIELYPRERQKS